MTLLVHKERKKCVRRAIISGLISQIAKSCKFLVAASSFGYVTDDRTNGFSERARCEASRVASLHSIEKPKIDPIGRLNPLIHFIWSTRLVIISKYLLDVSRNRQLIFLESIAPIIDDSQSVFSTQSLGTLNVAGLVLNLFSRVT